MDWIIDIGNWAMDLIPNLQIDEVLDKVIEQGGTIEELGKGIQKTAKSAQESSDTFLGIAIWDDDFWKLLFRFGITFSVLMIVIRFIYYPIAKRKDYLFTYFMISILIFTICFTLKKFELGMGMALGLFAIFGIIRYRTDPIPIKEMTYLFIVIGVSVINALANKKMSYAELAFVNLTIIGATYGMERLWLLKHESRKSVVYEKIDLIKPENEPLLVADLETRTGLKINRVEIGKIDFLKDTAQVYIYYFQDEQSTHFRDEGISS